MKSTTTRVLLLIFGILLIIMGIALFATPVANSVAVAYIICFLMIIYGIVEISHYFSERKLQIASGWTLADGIITVILGVILLFTPSAAILTTVWVFAFWLLFTGIMRTAGAFTAKKARIKGWGWILAAGIIGILLGILFMCEPLFTITVIGFSLPILFIIQGISAVAMFFTRSDS